MRYAIIENKTVVNVIIAEPDVVDTLFDNAVLETETTNSAWIGARYNGAKFEPVKIYESWTWNEEAFEYEPPTPKPEGDYYWNESELKWLPIPTPIDPETGLEILEVEAE